MRSDKREVLRKRTIYLISIIIFSILGSAIVYFIAANRIRENMVDEYIQNKITAMTGEFSARTERLENSIGLFAKWGQNGLINLEDTASFERAFIPVLTDAENIYAITIIENSGKEYQIIRKDSLYQSSFYFPKKSQVLKKIIDKNGKTITATSTHKQSSEKEIFWLPEDFTDTTFRWQGPLLYNGKEVVSISSSWKNKDSVKVYIAIHVLLKDFFKAFSNVEVSNNEYIFLLNRLGDVYNVLGYEGFVDKQYKRQFSMHPFYRVKVPQISKAVENWISNQKDVLHTLRFRIKNNFYWYKFVPVNGVKSKYLLGIVVSNKSVNSKIGKKNFQVISFALIIILLGVILIFWVVVWTSKKIEKIKETEIRENHTEEDISRLAGMPESKTLEFKSTIRYNLHTKTNDKAIQHAWLKGVAAFLNTEGGVLLIGIADDGSFLGIDNDGFENEDKALLHIKNLINKNIGIEFMSFISLFTANIEGKTIVAIQCEQATKPAYLKNGSEEEFYVRSQASSSKLSVADAVEYIFSHGYKRIVK